MSDGRLVLDTSVLSAFHAAGWFDALAFWYPGRSPTVSRSVWTREFVPHHDVGGQPEWLTVVNADLDRLDIRVRGQLGEADWTCVELGERYDRTTLVTNDDGIRTVAECRNVEVVWGTAFAMETYEGCGLAPSEFETGVPGYVEDVHLPEAVASELAATEKPDHESEDQ